MANPEHIAILKQGVAEWNRWRAERREEKPDLREADLRMAHLFGANFSRANLTGADLSKANLRGANLVGAIFSEVGLRPANLSRAVLSEANLRGANLVRAILRNADLIRANVNGTDLREADLTEANLSGADLVGPNLGRAILSDATVGWTVFANVDLRVAAGLETIRHVGPSTIGLDTIHKSCGNIPEVFLRGAGVPDNLITYLGSLVGKPIDFYSCFISYSTKDQEFADRLHADLQAKGVRCWFAPHHIAGGRKIHEQIDEAIRLHERLLLILSPSSMESEWVKTEIAKARKREVREQRRVLFPVRLVDFEALRDWEYFDADTGKDFAREIREYFIPDFRLWKDDHDAYKREFDRLLNSLKTEAQKE